MPANYIVKLENVSKSYGVQQWVFESVNLALQDGELVAAQGPIGSGKTTLLNIIAGFQKPNAGRVLVRGTDITYMNGQELIDLRAKTFGIVSQTQNLIPELTIAQNIELPLILQKIPKAERERKVQEVLARIGISKMAQRIVGTLSVGEREIVAIARSMVSDAPIIIMDEPTEALDPMMTDIIVSFIKGDYILRKKTILIATHDKRIAHLASRIVHVRKRIP